MTLWMLLSALALAQDRELPDVEPEPVPDAVEDADEPEPVEDVETALPEPPDTPVEEEEEDARDREIDRRDEAEDGELLPGTRPVAPPRTEGEELPASELERALEETEPVPPLISPEQAADPLPPAAVQPAEPEPADEPDRIEITVFGPAAIRQARLEVVREMRNMGYDAIDKGGGRYVFRPPESWMGRVVLEEDGTLEFRRPIIAFRNAFLHDRQREDEITTPPGMEPNPNISRTPEGHFFFDDALDEGEGFAMPPLQGSVYVLPAMELLEPIREAVARRVAPMLEEYRQVRENTFLMERLQMVEANLEAAWEEGLPLQGVGGQLTTMEERRRAILEFWGTRLPNPEGLAVSRVVEEFLRNRVMKSEHPATAEEIAWAESLRQDDRDLLLRPAQVYELQPEDRADVDATLEPDDQPEPAAEEP